MNSITHSYTEFPSHNLQNIKISLKLYTNFIYFYLNLIYIYICTDILLCMYFYDWCQSDVKLNNTIQYIVLKKYIK